MQLPRILQYNCYNPDCKTHHTSPSIPQSISLSVVHSNSLTNFWVKKNTVQTGQCVRWTRARARARVCVCVHTCVYVQDPRCQMTGPLVDQRYSLPIPVGSFSWLAQTASLTWRPTWPWVKPPQADPLGDSLGVHHARGCPGPAMHRGHLALQCTEAILPLLHRSRWTEHRLPMNRRNVPCDCDALPLV